jgi:hypothetical protein
MVDCRQGRRVEGTERADSGFGSSVGEPQLSPGATTARIWAQTDELAGQSPTQHPENVPPREPHPIQITPGSAEQYPPPGSALQLGNVPALIRPPRSAAAGCGLPDVPQGVVITAHEKACIVRVIGKG